MTSAQFFDKAPDGQNVTRWTIHNGGNTAAILSWGATVQEFRVAGSDRSLMLGGQDLSAYLGPMRYFGAVVGPVANRIAGGQMTVGGVSFDLDKNEAGRTTLHSGNSGFSDCNWAFANLSDTSCQLRHMHRDGQGGFPGNLLATVTYSLDDEGALEVTITGQTDAPTYFSPAFHGYWNLSGIPDASDHMLTVPAETYLPVDADQIPIGAPQPVAQTAFDYRVARHVGAVLDHNFCLAATGDLLHRACTVAAGGVSLTVTTDQPGVQIYKGRHIDTGLVGGVDGHPYGPCAGIAVEPQFWPDTPHQPTYPSSLLTPGAVSVHRSRFQITH